MALRIWLHEGHDGEPGLVALGLDFLGFSTWAGTEAELLARIRDRFGWYAAWRARHGIPVDPGDGRIEIVEHRVGNEILFPPDREPATPTEIELTLRLLAGSRADLLATLEVAPEAALDWDPPYRRFASWASWRTIRANLAHIANGETHYYTRNIGHEPSSAPADAQDDWRTFLPSSRREVVAFLEQLSSSSDLRRVRRLDHGQGPEDWSVRKALRRMVGHELLHWKSILRILGEFRRTDPPKRSV